MSIIIPQGGGGGTGGPTITDSPSNGGKDTSGLRAYSDPVIFRDDRVLKTLLRKESKYLPSARLSCGTEASSSTLSPMSIGSGPGIKPQMRKEVADWMLEVCEVEKCHPEVFCLAMNYLDRFLSVCSIGRSQLQLLGAVCLMVAWKVREHEPLPAVRLVEYSDFNLTPADIMEWEVLLLSKLDWDMSAVIAFDFVEHIIQRIRKTQFHAIVGITSETLRKHSETLITMCSAQDVFSSFSPSLIAAACVMTTLRPLLMEDSSEDNISSTPSSSVQLIRNTPSPSSCSSNSSTPIKSKTSKSSKIPDVNQVLDIVQNFTLADKECVRKCMDQIEILMHASLPPSPTSSPTHLRLGGNNSNLRLHLGSSSSPIQPDQFSSITMDTNVVQSVQQESDDSILKSSSQLQEEGKEYLPSTPERGSQSLTSSVFSSPFSDESTPTKILDVARKNC